MKTKPSKIKVEILFEDSAEFSLSNCIKTETDPIRKADCANKLGLIYSEGFFSDVSYRRAIDSYKIAYTLEPDNMIYVHNLGLAYFNDKSYHKALPLLKRCALAGLNKTSSYNIVTCASKLGLMYIDGLLGKDDHTEAFAYYKIANHFEPDNEAYSHNLAFSANTLGVMHQKTDIAKAYSYYKLARQLNPDSATYNKHSADASYLLSLYQEAKPLYILCLKDEFVEHASNLKKADCANSLASIYFSEELFGKAIETLRLACELSPKSPEYVHNLAIGHFRVHNYKEAGSLFAQCAEADLTEHFTQYERDECIKGLDLSGIV